MFQYLFSTGNIGVLFSVLILAIAKTKSLIEFSRHTHMSMYLRSVGSQFSSISNIFATCTTFYGQILTAFQYGIGVNSLTFISSVAFVGLHRNGKWLQTDNKFGITADFGAPSGGRSRSPVEKWLGRYSDIARVNYVIHVPIPIAYSKRFFFILTFLGWALDWVGLPFIFSLVLIKDLNWVNCSVSV